MSATRVLRCIGAAALLGLALGSANPALGQSAKSPSSEDDTEAARRLGVQGLKAYDAGDFAEALALFDQSSQVLRTPTVELYAARCLERLGRWVEAEARLEGIAKIFLAEGASQTLRDAKAEAVPELQRLRALLPKLRITIGGAPRTGVRLKLDGEDLAMPDGSAEVAVDPGSHTLTGTYGDQTVTQTFTVAQGATAVAALQFQSGEAEDAAAASTSTQETLGWVAVGVGGASVLAGVVVGLMALGKKNDLADQGCDSEGCASSFQSDVDDFDTLSLVSAVTFYGGLATLGAGVVLVVTASPPGADRPADALLEVRGTF